MTRDEFKNAIRKGQGRVIQCLRDSPGTEYVEIIEHACTHHLAYDPQCEGSREDYMTEVAEHVGGLQRFRNAILDSLKGTTSYWDSSQLFGLARRLAAAGDREIRNVIYSRFESIVSNRQNLAGALDIVELDSRNGLRHVASAFGRECLKDADYWPDDIRWFTNEDFPDGKLAALLEEMANDDPEVRAYVDRLTVQKAHHENSPPRPSNEELERMTFDAIMSHSALGTSIVGPFMMQRWGKAASDAEFQKAALALERESDPAQLKLLVSIFGNRPYPGTPGTLLKNLKSYGADPFISRRFELALQIVQSPAIRAAALHEIRHGGNLSRGLYLLCANYQAGDADLIIQTLPSDDQDFEFIHNVGHALLDLFDEVRICDATEAFVWMWEHSPCALCREHSFERLNSIGSVPDWMREEAKFDCLQSLRSHAKGGSDQNE